MGHMIYLFLLLSSIVPWETFLMNYAIIMIMHNKNCQTISNVSVLFNVAYWSTIARKTIARKSTYINLDLSLLYPILFIDKICDRTVKGKSIWAVEGTEV